MTSPAPERPMPRATPTEIALPVVGMTCASCVRRIERFLDRTPGVETASVNLATEMATIRYLPEVAGPADLVGAIEAAGYEVRTRPPQPEAGDDARPPAMFDEATDLEAAARAREQRMRVDSGTEPSSTAAFSLLSK